jgi:hypothetical protein
MKFLNGGTASSRARILVRVCGFGAIAAIVATLWFLRRHFFNATNAGWGDSQQDRHQALLGWAVAISATAAVVFIVLLCLRSNRLLLSVAIGTALTGLPIVAVHVIPSIPRVVFILDSPGILFALLVFGIHSGGGLSGDAYAFIANAILYTALAYCILRVRSAYYDA